jgi:hypothetical protein
MSLKDIDNNDYDGYIVGGGGSCGGRGCGDC